MQKTSAWPLALLYAALIAYASLYPFSDWRDQGMSPWAFMYADWPQYWTGFDVGANLVGYAPLGMLLTLGFVRSRLLRPVLAPVALATLLASLLSLGLETAQAYLPMRVPSNLDWLLNSAGAASGALWIGWLLRRGTVDRWRWQADRWFVPDARGVLVLLAMWPVALLFPVGTPFGLGQVFERSEAHLLELLQGTPFIDWLPLREQSLLPMQEGTQALCVSLGLLAPVWLGYAAVRSWWRRLVVLLSLMLLGAAVTSLSAALSYGPVHALAWATAPVQGGLVLALALALLTLGLRIRALMAWLILVLAVQLVLVNQASGDVYLAQTLQAWEQGRFIRFNGLAQWIGWIWPFAALVLVLARASTRDPKA